MNREIKFRAWDNINKSWLSENELVIYKGKVLCNIVDSKKNWQEELGFMEGIHLQQYTGLIDKHGKDIFEGDIVTFKINGVPQRSFYDENINREIWFDTERSGFHIGRFTSLLRSDEPHIEVIGNIWENPELLE